jgi:hypothetical protein
MGVSESEVREGLQEIKGFLRMAFAPLPFLLTIPHLFYQMSYCCIPGPLPEPND